jgi:hypothetical protein
LMISLCSTMRLISFTTSGPTHTDGWDVDGTAGAGLGIVMGRAKIKEKLVFIQGEMV